MKFEIHTSVITKIENNEKQALITACKLSRKYGRATIWNNHQKLASYKSGVKVN